MYIFLFGTQLYSYKQIPGFIFVTYLNKYCAGYGLSKENTSQRHLTLAALLLLFNGNKLAYQAVSRVKCMSVPLFVKETGQNMIFFECHRSVMTFFKGFTSAVEAFINQSSFGLLDAEYKNFLLLMISSTNIYKCCCNMGQIYSFCCFWRHKRNFLHLRSFI